MKISCAALFLPLFVCTFSQSPLAALADESSTPVAETKDIVIADFEGKDYSNWRVEGDAFAAGPAHGAFPGQKPVSGFEGGGFASSLATAQKKSGRLTSPGFAITRNYIQFLIGGNLRSEAQSIVNLVADGKIVRTAAPKPGGGNSLRYASWSVADLKGKTVEIEIVAPTNPGDAVMVDSLVQTDRELQNSSSTVNFTGHYLHVPIKNGGRRMAFEILAEGKVVRVLDLELAVEAAPDWWATDDISALRGKTGMIVCGDKSPEAISKKIAGLFQQSDETVVGGGLYRESGRPQFHFTVERGWNNDPNGLAYFNGEYHMFFQKNPYGLTAGNFRAMHWGHAVSKDLFHWTELAPAIYPIQSGIFSGGAFVDHGNQLGFGQGAEDVLFASYTGTGENLAFGTGRALALHDLPGNPVITHHGRDPKIIRYEPGNKWVMVVYEEAAQTGYAFYESTDLKFWRRMFCIEGGHECPEFFEMPVEGESTRKWVLYGAVRRVEQGSGESGARFIRSAYMIGNFDGNKFTPETDFTTGLSGPSFYAAQTFANAPDGRRIMLAWLQGAVYPGMPFCQGMTVPMDLKLRRTPEGLRMFFSPANEIGQLRTSTAVDNDLSVADANAVLAKVKDELLDMSLDIANAPSGKITFRVRGNTIAWDPATQELSCRNTKTKLHCADGHLRLRVLVDHGVLELFANDGIAGMTFGGKIEGDNSTLELTTVPGARVQSIRISGLKSIWGNK